MILEDKVDRPLKFKLDLVPQYGALTAGVIRTTLLKLKLKGTHSANQTAS